VIADLLVPLVSEVFARALARKTPPGEGHVVLSEGEEDLEYLRRRFERTSPSAEDAERRLRALRNRMAHSVVHVTAHGDLSDENILPFQAAERESSQLLIDFGLTPRLVALSACESGLPGAVLSTNYDEIIEQSLDMNLLRERIAEAMTTIAQVFVERMSSEVELFEKVDEDEARQLAETAADQVIASLRWSQAVGDRLDTTQVTHLIRVTRQALAKRQVSGSLLGLPGRTTTWYPTWQFDMTEHRIRPEVRDIVGAFRDQLENPDPFVIASWANTPQVDLDDVTPAQWLAAGYDARTLSEAAQRAAARLAQ
jgi:hypothetical protein